MAQGATVGIEEQNRYIQQWVQWVQGIIGQDEWTRRCSSVHEFVVQKLAKKSFAEMLVSHVPKDLAAWHMYLCDRYLHNQFEYNIFQGARVIPVVLALVRNGFPITLVPGAADRIRYAVTKQPAQFENTLFELLVASSYVRQGWSVEFLEETRTGPQPDLRVVGPRGELLVECKRKSRVSDYSDQERARWLELFRPVQQLLVVRRLAALINVTFHIPLISLDENYLIQRVGPSISEGRFGVVVDDDEMRVELSRLNLHRLQSYLQQSSLRLDSGLFNHLLFGAVEPWRNVSHTIQARQRVVGTTVFIDAVNWATAAVWSCNAPGSIGAKARHLKRDLAEAVRQFPDRTPGVVHWGIDVYDQHISAEILRKTLQTMGEFNPGDKDLRLVYCHLFEAWVPPNGNWDFQETCHYLGTPDSYRLANPLLVAPEGS